MGEIPINPTTPTKTKGQNEPLQKPTKTKTINNQRHQTHEIRVKIQTIYTHFHNTYTAIKSKKGCPPTSPKKPTTHLNFLTPLSHPNQQTSITPAIITTHKP